MEKDESNRVGPRAEEFIELLVLRDPVISAYVMSLVPSNSDAQDMLRQKKKHWLSNSGEVKPSVLRPEKRSVRKRTRTR